MRQYMKATTDGNGSGSCRAVFLDRDGTINVDKEYLYKKEDFEYMDGAVEGMRVLTEMGFYLVVVTNQSGIARGYYTEDDYRKLDEWMKKDLMHHGVNLAKSYYCPHLPDALIAKYQKDCMCRKPNTGLFWKACRELDINMDRSFVVGDRLRDLCICQESGVQGILITQRKISKEENMKQEHIKEKIMKEEITKEKIKMANKKIAVCSDWYQVIEEIKQQCGLWNTE